MTKAGFATYAAQGGGNSASSAPNGLGILRQLRYVPYLSLIGSDTWLSIYRTRTLNVDHGVFLLYIFFGLCYFFFDLFDIYIFGPNQISLKYAYQTMTVELG